LNIINHLDSLQMLRRERLILENSWSNETAYPNMLAGSMYKISSGQCFVTSLFIYFQLKSFSNKNKCILQRGVVLASTNRVLLHDHCWLEIVTEKRQKIIIDLTIDQINSIEESVLCHGNDYIVNEYGLIYMSFRNYEYNSYNEIHNENTLVRYRRLLLNRSRVIYDQFTAH
jgi:hypothetical protein